MPIGGKSYYDSTDPSINHPEPKLAMFRRNDAKNGKSDQKQAESEAASSSQATLTAQHIDAVVTQIIELASRTGSVLQRAEEMARRAEEMFCQITEATQRAEAAAMRAELAATRTELNVITGMPQTAEFDQPVDDDRTEELEMVAQITERLRNGLQQIEGLTASYTEPEPAIDKELVEDLPTPSGTMEITQRLDVVPRQPVGIRSDFDSEPMNARTADTLSFARTPGTTGESDALAHSLVSVCHDTGMPRVSPYIIQVPPSSDGDHYNGTRSRSNGHDKVHAAV